MYLKNVRMFSAVEGAMCPTTALSNYYFDVSTCPCHHCIDLCGDFLAVALAARLSVAKEWSACWSRNQMLMMPTLCDFAYCTIYSQQLWPYFVGHSIVAMIDNCSNWPQTMAAVCFD